MFERPLQGSDGAAEKTQFLLQPRNGLGQSADPSGQGGRQQQTEPDDQRDQRHHDDQRRQPTRQTGPLQQPQHRLKHQVQHKGQHDRQDDLGRGIAGGERRQHKQPSQEDRAQLDRLFHFGRLQPVVLGLLGGRIRQYPMVGRASREARTPSRQAGFGRTLRANRNPSASRQVPKAPLPHRGRGRGPSRQRWEGEGFGSRETLTRPRLTPRPPSPAMRERDSWLRRYRTSGSSKVKPWALSQPAKPTPSGVLAWRALSSDQP